MWCVVVLLLLVEGLGHLVDTWSCTLLGLPFVSSWHPVAWVSVAAYQDLQQTVRSVATHQGCIRW